MNQKTAIGGLAVLALVVPLVLGGGSGWAATQYLGDGALQNARKGWDLPIQGSCLADPTKQTRAACLALRFPAYTTSATCVVSNAPNAPLRSWSTGSCNDLVNNADQATCEAQPDRMWSNGVCAIIMLDDDRNNVTCALHGGNWITSGVCTGNWAFGDANAYTPPLLTGSATATAPNVAYPYNSGPGDQCLRCHNSRTQYNSPRVRDTEDTLFMGHKNMARKVAPGFSWGGPPFACSNPLFTAEEPCLDNGGTWDPVAAYPFDDSGNAIHWDTGKITVSSVDRDMTWIYGDWLSPLPRAIYKTVPATTKVCLMTAYTDQTSCQTAGFAWLGGSCEDPTKTSTTCTAGTWGTGPSGVCDDPQPAYSKYADCRAAGKAWIQNAGASYSCGRCHTTGWTSDTLAVATKEPEKSFPGISWARSADAGFGVVSLAGGVTGDSNKFSSWDVWGISCARCHSAAIDTTSHGGVPPFSAPSGMSTHHSNLTAPDNSSGVCTDSRWTAETQCLGGGGTWLTACSLSSTAALCLNAATTSTACAGSTSGVWVSAPAWCSNAYYSDQTSCEANAFTWQAGWCTRPDVTTSGSCTGGTGVNALTWRTNGSQASCQVAGGTWSFSKCDKEGVCNMGAAYTSKAACEAQPNGYWAAITDVIRCEDAGGKWTGTNTNRGQIITRLCMDCHRQETGGLPYANTGSTAGTYATVNPGGYVKVGPAHGTVAPVSHPHGNQFLNSPHSLFSGTFNQIATGKFNFAMTGEYKSYFQVDAEAANTGNGCTGCHEVHTSVVAGEKPFREECTECHAGPYKKDLTKILHPWGPGTPMEEAATDESSACETCHMPGAMHLWRINTSPLYSTFPAAALTDTVNANTSPAFFGTSQQFDNAVWNDVDLACGQCHGGGTARVGATGTLSTTANAKLLNVTGVTDLTTGLPASFTAGSRIKIPGAGTLEPDGSRDDFETYVVSATSSTVTLAGAASGSVTGVSVEQNPTKNGASYKTKAALAVKAQGIHSGVPATPPYVSFSATLGAYPNTQTVNVDASASTCDGSAANCNAYSWNWGDGTPAGTGVATSHTYLTGGMKSITLSVEEFGVTGGSLTKNVTVYVPDAPPVAASTCLWVPETWTMTLTDASTDDIGLKQETVNWGDGTAISNDTTAPFGPFTHTYLNPGSFTISHKAIDTIGQQNIETACAGMAVPAYFSISGHIYAPDGTTPLPIAVIKVYKGATYVKSTFSISDGTYSVGYLKPGDYTLVVSKTGYTFGAVPPVSVGLSKPGIDVVSTGKVFIRQTTESFGVKQAQ